MSRSSRTANAAARVHSLRAANDNRRTGKSDEPGRRTVLVHCGIPPVLMGKAADIGRLVQQWPIAANDNDNATACGPKKEKE